jgi:oxalate decarboxylase/phosphoglucose isomerase-like protein (cupin superfamily)
MGSRLPPTVIHATEPTGSGPHIMLNIFAPARGDHIKNGMVLNSKEYTLASQIEAEIK